ncbi:AAA family ATPase [Mycoplasma sp. 2634B]
MLNKKISFLEFCNIYADIEKYISSLNEFKKTLINSINNVEINSNIVYEDRFYPMQATKQINNILLFIKNQGLENKILTNEILTLFFFLNLEKITKKIEINLFNNDDRDDFFKSELFYLFLKHDYEDEMCEFKLDQEFLNLSFLKKDDIFRPQSDDYSNRLFYSTYDFDFSKKIDDINKNSKISALEKNAEVLKECSGFFFKFIKLLFTEFYQFKFNIDSNNVDNEILKKIFNALQSKKNLVLIYDNNLHKNIWQGIINNFLNINNIHNLKLHSSEALLTMTESKNIGRTGALVIELKKMLSSFTTKEQVCYWFENWEPIIFFGTSNDTKLTSETFDEMLSQKMFYKASNIIWMKVGLFNFCKNIINYKDSSDCEYIYLNEIPIDKIANSIADKINLPIYDTIPFIKFCNDYLSDFLLEDILNEYNCQKNEYTTFLINKLNNEFGDIKIPNLINDMKNINMNENFRKIISKALLIINDPKKIKKTKPYSVMVLGNNIDTNIFNNISNYKIFYELDLDKINPIALFDSNPLISDSLINIIKNHPNAIICFNNIQKAPKSVINKFLNILDEGYLVDNNNQKYYCYLNTFILIDSDNDKIQAFNLQNNCFLNDFLTYFYPPEFIARFTDTILNDSEIDIPVVDKFINDFIQSIKHESDIKIIFNYDSIKRNIGNYLYSDAKLNNLKFEILKKMHPFLIKYNTGKIIIFCEYGNIRIKYEKKEDTHAK